MRLSVSAGVATLLATGLLVGNAVAGRPPDTSAKSKTRADEQTVFVTGSLIPQRIRVRPIGTTTVSPIRVIDRHEIDQTGRRTAAGILLADPSVRVIGR